MGLSLQFFSIVGFLCLVPSTSCPTACRCTSTARLSADCSYRKLMHVPEDLPVSLNQLTLAVNQITDLNCSSFANSPGLTSLWLAYNQITTIHPGTFQNLTQLINLDLSHNQIVDFPWSDLATLEKLQLLNLNNNQLLTLPPGALNNCRSLRSLQLSSNRLYSLPEGLFHTLISLSHLQLHSNSFHCSCSLAWLMEWLQKAEITIDRKGDIVCLSPNEFKGVSLEKVPDLQCRKPLEIVGDDPVLVDTLLLCKEVGFPYVMILKDSREHNSYNEIEVAIRKLVNGSFTVTPVKKDMAYLCRVYNHTSQTTGDISVSISQTIPGWPMEPREKLLLFLVSGKVRSEANAASCVMAVPRLWWQALLVLMWQRIP
ncbi:immunoglobulin superfamily containing leucine-rich repeat protein 2-like [Pseudophryne corroboree]|uniref:immunoglobulin superfamily containing leucine-rich repeat protein 2-like n=1 Tax=Pseudophryne corroboree TaxID=495146 RepID=UPI003081F768